MRVRNPGAFEPYTVISYRRATFSGWPRKWVLYEETDWAEAKPCTERFAQAGFTWTPDDPQTTDRVTCPCCHLSVDGWEAADDPMRVHVKLSPDCLFAVNVNMVEQNKIDEARRKGTYEESAHRPGAFVGRPIKLEQRSYWEKKLKGPRQPGLRDPPPKRPRPSDERQGTVSSSGSASRTRFVVPHSCPDRARKISRHSGLRYPPPKRPRPSDSSHAERFEDKWSNIWR